MQTVFDAETDTNKLFGIMREFMRKDYQDIITPYPRLVGQIGSTRLLTAAANQTVRQTLLDVKFEGPSGCHTGFIVTVFSPPASNETAKGTALLSIRVIYGAGGVVSDVTLPMFQGGSFYVPGEKCSVEAILSKLAGAAVTMQVGAFASIAHGNKHAPVILATGYAPLGAGLGLAVTINKNTRALRLSSVQPGIHNLRLDILTMSSALTTQESHLLLPGQNDTGWIELMSNLPQATVANLDVVNSPEYLISERIEL